MATHLIRAAVVGALVLVVATTRSVPLVLGLVFLLEFAGGPAITSSQMLLTDLFPDRRLFARAFGLTTLATQVNQAIGLALGGAVVGLIGESKALVIDLLTFLVGAAVLAFVHPPQSHLEPGEGQLASLVGDLQRGWREIRASRVLTLLLILSLVSALAMAAPEAVALPYASLHSGSRPGAACSWVHRSWAPSWASCSSGACPPSARADWSCALHC